MNQQLFGALLRSSSQYCSTFNRDSMMWAHSTLSGGRSGRCDGARPLLWNVLWNLRRACRKVRLVWADAGYNAGKLAAWAAALKITMQVVARREQHVLEVLPAAGW